MFILSSNASKGTIQNKKWSIIHWFTVWLRCLLMRSISGKNTLFRQKVDYLMRDTMLVMYYQQRNVFYEVKSRKLINWLCIVKIYLRSHYILPQIYPANHIDIACVVQRKPECSRYMIQFHTGRIQQYISVPLQDPWSVWMNQTDHDLIVDLWDGFIKPTKN